MNPVLATARSYLEAGLGVLPIRLDGTKAPALQRGHSYLRERPTLEDLEAWFSRGQHGIAIPSGRVSGHLETLDFETLAVFTQWKDLVEAQLPGVVGRLTLCRTPGHLDPEGGIHVRYRCPEIEIPGSMKLAGQAETDAWGDLMRNARGDLVYQAIIETRGEGGYAIAPGSPPATHPSGRVWQHLSGPPLTELSNVTSIEREILLASARALNRWIDARDQQHTQPASTDRLLPGDDFNARGPDWAEILEPHGWVRVRVDGTVRFWRRPGKDRGISATTDFCRAGDLGLFHVFTSNASPFDMQGTYSKFSAWTLLNHRGDFKAAARDLISKGFGENLSPRDAASNARRGTNGECPAEPRSMKVEIELPEPPPWPEPPDDLIYQGLAGEITQLIEPQTEADPLAVLVQILVMFGNACGRHAHWRVEETCHYGNLYCCLVGETAKGRKGTAKDRALRAFDCVSDRWHERIASGLSSGEGLIMAVSDPTYKTHHIKQRGRVVDTQQILDNPGVADKRLLIVEPEFARVLRVLDREGNTLSARLREAWDHGNLVSMTKASCRATGAHLSLIAHITRIELRKSLTSVDAANGLANRFLWFAVRRSKLLPLGGERIDLGTRAHKLALAVEQAQTGTREIPFDRETMAFWQDEVYARLTKGRPGLLGAITNRAESQVRRLALLYALLDFCPEVRMAHLLAALAMWDYSERSCAWIFGDSTGDSKADEILEALKAAGEHGLTQTNIRDLFGRNEPKAALGEALALLIEAGLITAEKRSTGGRAAKVFRLVGGTTKTTEVKKATEQGVASNSSPEPLRQKGPTQ